MQVRCDVCGAAPAAVLCCADEAALCSACDLRVHRANKLAHKHRRVPLVQVHGDAADSAADATAPLCDVCKERRGLVFCVEDRAILCPDCDDPIHAANHLTAKHTRFLLVGAKLSLSAAAAALVDDKQEDDDDEEEEYDCTADADAEAVPAVCAPPPQGQGQQASSCAAANAKAKASALDSGGGSTISDYLTNICPGWRVDDLLFEFDDPAFSPPSKGGYSEELVPSLDAADLFDVVAAGRPGKRGGGGGGLGFFDSDKVPTQGRVRETTSWSSVSDSSDSDVFAVPEFPQPPTPPAKKARPAPSPSPAYWCF